MIDKLEKERPQILKHCNTIEADRGYDDTKLIQKLYDQHKIKPVIDIRNMWKDPDKTRSLPGYENVIYNYKGNVYCCCQEMKKTEKHLKNYALQSSMD